MAGPLFRELAEDLAYCWPPSLLYTGHSHTAAHSGSQFLTIKEAPGYNRSNNFTRVISWFHYFFKTFFIIYSHPGNALLFIVSNPPFLGLVGLFFKLIRKQKYVILVYDIYPDLLIDMQSLKKGILSKVWDYLNRVVYQNSDMVVTIGRDMASNLGKKFNVLHSNAGKVIYIPNWADINKIKPISKKENWFAQKHGQVNKITVLYSGNMGNTHDIESILYASGQLSDNKEINFLFIGEGQKWRLVQKTIKKNNLSNITLLPFQAEKVLPYSLTTGDIGIVSFERGTETYICPSKTYYYMAAGLALLVVSEKENEISRMVTEYNCGINVKSGDSLGLKKAILDISANKETLDYYKRSSRKTVERYCSRKNTQLYADAIRAYASISS